ncbi:MAG: hypothetical protein GKR95_16120 [Gammaproteobacteria bacterium]|nr:hypothetical protein [Gammaproteobacteria bacterium]
MKNIAGEVSISIYIPYSLRFLDSELSDIFIFSAISFWLRVFPFIGHLKHDHRLLRSWLKGAEGDRINLLMAGCAWNLRKWMIAFFLFEKPNGGEQTLLAIACCQPLGTPLIVVWVLS